MALAAAKMGPKPKASADRTGPDHPAKQVQGIAGALFAIVEGTLTLKSIPQAAPLPALHT